MQFQIAETNMFLNENRNSKTDFNSLQYPYALFGWRCFKDDGKWGKEKMREITISFVGLEENGVRLEREFSPCPQFFFSPKGRKNIEES